MINIYKEYKIYIRSKAEGIGSRRNEVKLGLGFPDTM